MDRTATWGLCSIVFLGIFISELATGEAYMRGGPILESKSPLSFWIVSLTVLSVSIWCGYKFYKSYRSI